MTSLLLLLSFSLAAEAPDSSAKPPDSERRAEIVRQVFNAIHEKSIEFVEKSYSTEIVFTSPLGTVEGQKELQEWYVNLFEKVETIAFEINGTYAAGDTLTVEWVMTVKAEDLNRGKEVQTSGASILKFDEADRVIYHRDYYDLGEFVYEHVTILRRLVAKAKKRMTP